METESCTHHDKKASKMLRWSQSVAGCLDLGRIDMADPQGMEAEGERIREVGRVERGVGEELRGLCGWLEEGSVCHGGVCAAAAAG